MENLYKTYYLYIYKRTIGSYSYQSFGKILFIDNFRKTIYALKIYMCEFLDNVCPCTIKICINDGFNL